MASAKKSAKVAPQSGATISNCTFTVEAPEPLTPDECKAVCELASAVSANAKAIETLASKMRGSVNNYRSLLELGGL